MTRLARDGASVVVADIADDAGGTLVAQIEGEGHPAEYVHTDVGSSVDICSIASDDAAFLTGVILDVDDGRSI